ncbi:U-scoloptoxin(05)-Sm1a [Frankliniella fusca]|uniref:U-scoloptoxin(05)-Sm1a n=1 Tax=Frankliniella fusca TaxID=407009 RepID=A0AAE1H7P7_9NEOP|nr:U-scoloptoxin(05)-Sm1a [Frankliniella fusca]
MIALQRESHVFVLMIVLVAFLNPANAIECYQCESTDHNNPFQCSEFMPEDSELKPTSCDNVHNAQYCVKLVGRNRVSGWFWSGDVIKCYQCSSHDNLDCADNNIHDGSLEALDCSHIHKAKYCVKKIGRTEGVYTTSRQCSSVDLGNYCDYIKLQGDVMDYRSCVYTCESDGCNAAHSLMRPNVVVLLFSFVAVCTSLFLL